MPHDRTLIAEVPAGAPILSVRRLRVFYPRRREWPWQARGVVRAVNEVNFNLHAGETLGIVGESGCGKTSLARALAGLQPVTSGVITYGGTDLAACGERAWRPLRRDIQIVFQDPLASLNPRMTIGQSIAEPLRALLPELSAGERAARVDAMLERVGIASALRNRYPHEFSGGQCQRVGIARALVVRPKILICDEPVSALDVSVRAQIVNLLAELQREQQLTMIFIAHDLAVVRHVSHRVLVMYLGKIVEQGTRDDLFATPSHPYTRALLASVPAPDPEGPRPERIVLAGEPPNPAAPPGGCVFNPRCPLADGYQCRQEMPTLRRVTASHHAACHYTVAQW